MMRINPDGCARCRIAFHHAMFCGCTCHDGGPIKEQLEAQGFELGAQWYSYDNGLTWERCPMPDRYPVSPRTLTVTKIDRERGEITVVAAPLVRPKI